MYRRVWSAVIAAAVLIVPIANCSDAPAESRSADAELAQLVERLAAARVGVELAGKVTPEIRRELERLKRDVDSWQLRTGRNDITAAPMTHAGSRPPESSNDGVLARQKLPGTCACAPSYHDTSTGKTCFLMSSNCVGGTTCVYICYRVYKA